MSSRTLRYSAPFLLPWDETSEDRLRLWIPIFLFVLFALFLIVAIRLAPPIQPQHFQQDEVKQRLASFVMEQKKKQPKPKPKPEIEKPQKQEKAEQKTEKKEKPEKAQQKTEQKKTQETTAQPTKKQIAHARAKAKKRVAVFQNAFAGLREMAPSPNPGSSTGTGAMAGTAHDLQRGGAKSASISPGRDLIASAAGKGSGTTALVGAGHASGSGSKGGHGNGRLKGHGGGAGGAGGAVHSQLAESGAGKSTRKTPSGQTTRSDESIRRVFDRYAGLINSQYQRALRKNPTLQGTVVLHMTIQPSGEVTAVSIKSSELDDDSLMTHIKLIVKNMNFGKMNVAVWKGDYSLNFFPS